MTKAKIDYVFRASPDNNMHFTSSSQEASQSIESYTADLEERLKSKSNMMIIGTAQKPPKYNH